MSELLDFAPPAARQAVKDMAAKLSVKAETLTLALVAWDALKGLPHEERQKAIAVLLGLATRKDLR
jgi:hypothetical protein